VDDHPEPIKELMRLLDLYYRGRENESDTGNTFEDARSSDAYKNFCEFENFEERLCEGDFVDKRVIEFLLDKGKA